MIEHYIEVTGRANKNFFVNGNLIEGVKTITVNDCTVSIEIDPTWNSKTIRYLRGLVGVSLHVVFHNSSQGELSKEPTCKVTLQVGKENADELILFLFPED